MCYFAQRNYLWYGSCYQSYHLVKLMTYSLGPTCLLHRPERQVEWGCGGNQHPFILDILDSGTDLCDASRNTVLLLVYYLPTQRQLWGLPHGLFYHTS